MTLADARLKLLAELGLVYWFDTFIVATDDANKIRRIGADVVPATIGLVTGEHQ